MKFADKYPVKQDYFQVPIDSDTPGMVYYPSLEMETVCVVCGELTNWYDEDIGMPICSEECFKQFYQIEHDSEAQLYIEDEDYFNVGYSEYGD